MGRAIPVIAVHPSTSGATVSTGARMTVPTARGGLPSDILAAAVVVTTVLATLTLPAWRALLL